MFSGVQMFRSFTVHVIELLLVTFLMQYIFFPQIMENISLKSASDKNISEGCAKTFRLLYPKNP